ncbi:hypothetical protein SNE40_008115 [Patella caerulea]|uniref:Uncharacterized protein n=1 Tax=Patella caerulea TaxID=87958 RepID=A0AAN8JZE0_PATCE
MQRISVLVFLWAFFHGWVFSADITVDVSSLKPIHVIDSKFVGVTIDIQRIIHHFKHNDITSKKFINLAKGLLPCYLRVGGGAQKYLTFATHKNQTLTRDDWDKLNIMVKDVGWDLIFGLNLNLRKNGKWDPVDAIQLFQYTIEKGYHVAGWELGNEPDLHHSAISNLSMTSIASDFDILKTILDSIPEIKPYILVGGDFAHRKNIAGFLEGGAGHTVDAVTFHHYYMNGKTAQLDDFYSLDKLNTFEGYVEWAIATSKNYGNKPIWLGETSSGYGGGTPNLADRYVAGFMWLDKLGVSASRGIKGVFRQTLFGGNYALVSDSNIPNPDYWLTVLYKRLVGSPVLTPPNTNNRNIRMYAHCTNRNSDYNYPAGSVTIYMLNVGNTSVTVNLGHKDHLDLYMLTPGSKGGLASQTVKLNEKELFLYHDDQLPPLPGYKTLGDVTLEEHTFGFVVLPSVQASACK